MKRIYVAFPIIKNNIFLIVGVSPETIITLKMIARIFIFILLVAFIGCAFAEYVDHQRRDKTDRIESPEQIELGELGVETNEIR